jgi:hypothetical protein
VGSRAPSIRGGKAVIFNNYYLNIRNTGINSRLGAEVYCEKNYFDGVGTGKPKKPLQLGEGPIGAWYSKSPGKYNSVDNYYVNCLGNQPANSESTTSYKPSFMNNNKTVFPVMDVPELLMEKAGIQGKPKRLVYPVVITKISFKDRRVVHPSNLESSTWYNIFGVKIGPAHNKTTSGFIITNENGKWITRLGTMR